MNCLEEKRNDFVFVWNFMCAFLYAHIAHVNVFMATDRYSRE